MIAATALLAVLLMACAAATDLRGFVIPNRIPAGLLALLAIAWAAGAPVSPPSSAAALALVAVPALGLWLAGGLGGGDVKLLAAAAAWAGLARLPDLLLVMALVGGALALALLALRRLPPGSRLRRVPALAALFRETGVPYGVAIAAGGIPAALHCFP